MAEVDVNKPDQHARFVHVHLISDATGETVTAVAKACCAQFDQMKPILQTHALVRSPKQVAQVLNEIEASPGLVMFTVVNDEIRQRLEEGCAKLQVPCIPVLDPVIGALGVYLGAESQQRPGLQHEMDQEYFQRIDALNFNMSHDDGQNAHELSESDVILVGVSRTSKTPTCMYLANRGIRAANIPLIKGQLPQVDFSSLTGPLIIGLTANPEHLVQIRRNRLLSYEDLPEGDYVELGQVREEVTEARRLFARHNWPVIDVTRRSIEETAAAILNLYSHRDTV